MYPFYHKAFVKAWWPRGKGGSMGWPGVAMITKNEGLAKPLVTPFQIPK